MRDAYRYVEEPRPPARANLAELLAIEPKEEIGPDAVVKAIVFAQEPE